MTVRPRASAVEAIATLAKPGAGPAPRALSIITPARWAAWRSNGSNTACYYYDKDEKLNERTFVDLNMLVDGRHYMGYLFGR